MCFHLPPLSGTGAIVPVFVSHLFPVLQIASRAVLQHHQASAHRPSPQGSVLCQRGEHCAIDPNIEDVYYPSPERLPSSRSRSDSSASHPGKRGSAVTPIDKKNFEAPENERDYARGIALDFIFEIERKGVHRNSDGTFEWESEGPVSFYDPHTWRITRLPLNQIKWFLHYVLQLLRDEIASQSKYVRHVDAAEGGSTVVIGDIHGQLFALIPMLGDIKEKFAAPPFLYEELTGSDLFICDPRLQYIFLGDYVDRGQHNIEVVLLVLAYKFICPDSVTVLRGNHEYEIQNMRFGFCKEVYEYETLHAQRRWDDPTVEKISKEVDQCLNEVRETRGGQDVADLEKSLKDELKKLRKFDVQCKESHEDDFKAVQRDRSIFEVRRLIMVIKSDLPSNCHARHELLYEYFIGVFELLPILAVVEQSALAMHGGIDEAFYDQCRTTPGDFDAFAEEMVEGTVWGDPLLQGQCKAGDKVEAKKYANASWQPGIVESVNDDGTVTVLWSNGDGSKRALPSSQVSCKAQKFPPNNIRGGHIKFFSPRVAHEFLSFHGLRWLVRGHQVKFFGFEEFYWPYNPDNLRKNVSKRMPAAEATSIITVFSAVDYCAHLSKRVKGYGNSGAYLGIPAGGKSPPWLRKLGAETVRDMLWQRTQKMHEIVVSSSSLLQMNEGFELHKDPKDLLNNKNKTYKELHARAEDRDVPPKKLSEEESLLVGPVKDQIVQRLSAAIEDKTRLLTMNKSEILLQEAQLLLEECGEAAESLNQIKEASARQHFIIYQFTKLGGKKEDVPELREFIKERRENLMNWPEIGENEEVCFDCGEKDQDQVFDQIKHSFDKLDGDGDGNVTVAEILNLMLHQKQEGKPGDGSLIEILKGMRQTQKEAICFREYLVVKLFGEEYGIAQWSDTHLPDEEEDEEDNEEFALPLGMAPPRPPPRPTTPMSGTGMHKSS